MSSITPGSDWRGGAAAYRQPIGELELLAVEGLMSMVYYINCRLSNQPLGDIEYRSSDNDRDIRNHVFRWDTTPYQTIFVNGFEARREAETPANTYFNLEHFINNAGRPLEIARPATHAFISTTISAGWHPSLQEGQCMTVYRYEIYAPGGIWVNETLGTRNRYPNQREITFIGAIAPQYIRSAQEFRIERAFGSSYTTRSRADDILWYNTNFNPQSNPYRELRILRPVTYYYVPSVDSDGKPTREKKKLRKEHYPPKELDQHKRERRQVPDQDERERRQDPVDWYANLVENEKSYINAAFRASSTNEAYLFMENMYVLVNYAPGSKTDWIINGPLLICDGYRSLVDTPFGEYGLDCAFDTDRTEAFIFYGNLCAYIDYAPRSTNDKILQGPTTIATMFPFFRDTVFENGIDAAFRATASDEAYLFKDDQYALINYNNKTRTAIRHINQGFYSLRGTIFESGIQAAFASHRPDEAYIFKEDQYALINFAPGTTNDRIIGGVKKIREHWPSLAPILPLENGGVDDHDHHN